MDVNLFIRNKQRERCSEVSRISRKLHDNTHRPQTKESTENERCIKAILNLLNLETNVSLRVPVRALSVEYPSTVPRSPGPGPLPEGVKNLILRFREILAASGRRAIRSVTEMS